MYAGTPAIEGFNAGYLIQPDIYMAQSDNGWNGSWQRLGKILDHNDIEWHHNSRQHSEYEWGIEGPQLIALPNGKILLNATCFLCDGPFGTRQRVFFALSDSITTSYKSMGPVLKPSLDSTQWNSGENGHASAVLHNDKLYLFFQSRSRDIPQASDNNWRYGIAIYNLESFT